MRVRRVVFVTRATAKMLEAADRRLGKATVDHVLDRLLARDLKAPTPRPIVRRRAKLTFDELRANKSAHTKRVHDERRKAGICINASGGHGPVHRGGRCRDCWERKKSAEVAVTKLAASERSRRLAHEPRLREGPVPDRPDHAHL